MITAIDKNTALVIIDLQKWIVDNADPGLVSGVVKNAARLIDAFHEENLPVIPVKVNPVNGNLRHLRKDIDRSGKSFDISEYPQEVFDFVEEIKVNSSDITITKEGWNAFYNTPLDKELNKQGITGIVLCGVSTSVGVEGTARAGSELGYNISIATDAVADSSKEAHQHSLRNIFPRIAETGTVSDIVEKLRSRV